MKLRRGGCIALSISLLIAAILVFAVGKVHAAAIIKSETFGAMSGDSKVADAWLNVWKNLNADEAVAWCRWKGVNVDVGSTGWFNSNKVKDHVGTIHRIYSSQANANLGDDTVECKNKLNSNTFTFTLSISENSGKYYLQTSVFQRLRQKDIDMDKEMETAKHDPYYKAVCGDISQSSGGPGASSARIQCVNDVDNALSKCDGGTDKRSEQQCMLDELRGKWQLAGLSDADALAKLSAAADEKKNGENKVNNDHAKDNVSVPIEDDGSGARKKSCEIDQFGILGYMICPVANFFGFLADKFYEVIGEFLEVKASTFSTGGAAFKVYQTFLPLANILLAIIFLVIIYSEATGNGFGAMSNYSAKKILPRLIVFAILVNVSWWICAAAVDISNIIGANINEFFVDTANSDINNAKPLNGTSFGAEMMQANVSDQKDVNFADVAWAAGSTAAIAFFGQFSALFTIILMVVLVLALTFGILIIRQAGVIVLGILAPLAIACAVLPNTQSIFEKWKKFFIALLLTYPIIGLIYGGSYLAGTAILNAAGDDWTMKVAGLACTALPLVVAPFAIISSLNGVSTLGTKISGFASKRMGNQQKKLTDRMKSGYGNSMGHRKAVGAKSFMAGAAINALGDRKFGSRLISQNMRDAAAAGPKLEAERRKKNVEAAAIAMRNNPKMTQAVQMEIATTGMYNGRRVDQYTHQAAIEAQGSHMNAEQVDQMAKTVAEERSTMTDRSAQASGFNMLAEAAAKQAIDNGHTTMSDRDLRDMLGGKMSKVGADGKPAGLDYQRVADAQLAKARNINEDDLSKTTSDDITGQYNAIVNTYQKAGMSEQQAVQDTNAAIHDAVESYVARTAGHGSQYGGNAQRAGRDVDQAIYRISMGQDPR